MLPILLPRTVSQTQVSLAGAHQDAPQGPADTPSWDPPSELPRVCTISDATSCYLGKCGFEGAVWWQSPLQVIAQLEGCPEGGTAEAALAPTQLSVFGSDVEGG